MTLQLHNVKSKPDSSIGTEISQRTRVSNAKRITKDNIIMIKPRSTFFSIFFSKFFKISLYKPFKNKFVRIITRSKQNAENLIKILSNNPKLPANIFRERRVKIIVTPLKNNSPLPLINFIDSFFGIVHPY